MPLVPVWNRASSPCDSQAANTGQNFSSSGANACSDGWNLTPRSPSAAISATSSTADSLCGSTEPMPVNAPGWSRTAAATVALGTRGRPVAVSASQASRTASASSARYLAASSSRDCRSTRDRK